MTFRTAYNHVTATKFSTTFDDETLTEQAHANDVNVNVIVAKYTKTGMLPNVTLTPQYGDFTNVPDYRTALDMIRERQATFAALPASLRKQFSNDPAEFLAFVTNPENLDELRKMGLAKPEEKKAESPPPKQGEKQDDQK